MTYEDRRFINARTLSYYANTSEALLQGPVRGIVIEFPGLGGGSCLGGSMERGVYDTARTRLYAQHGVVCAYLFPGPWSWGNRGAIRMADAVIAALLEKYDLAENTPIVACGGSMGGLGALNYARYGRYALAGVAAACPCTDVLDRLNCHPDFPRTFISAVAGCDLPLESALKEISPIELIGDLPRVPYFICSDAEDEVFPESQCDHYVDELRLRGHSVAYYRQPEKKHGEFLPEVWEACK